MTAPLHLVSCVKLKAARPMPAADFYQSPWFKMARAYVERQGCRWFILSALHGLLAPDAVVSPYEETLNGMGVAARRAWGTKVTGQLEGLDYPSDASVVVLAGARYRDPISGWLGRRAVIPMEGLTIGRQLAWLSRHASSISNGGHNG